jgi:hypothetical protein
MKILITLIFCTNIHASVQDIVRCLAKEEQIYHKEQSQGPHYYLNQKFINKLVNYDKLSIHEDITKKVCDSSRSKTFTLLTQYILYPNNFFIKNSSIVDKKHLTQQDELANFFKLSFIEVLIKIQAQAKTPKCFKQIFPSTAKLFDQIKYTQVNNNLISIMDNLKNKQDLVARMWNVPEIFSQCKKQKNTK